MFHMELGPGNAVDRGQAQSLPLKNWGGGRQTFPKHKLLVEEGREEPGESMARGPLVCSSLSAFPVQLPGFKAHGPGFPGQPIMGREGSTPPPRRKHTISKECGVAGCQRSTSIGAGDAAEHN